MCVRTLEETAEEGLKERPAFGAEDTGPACEIGERVVHVTARTPVL